MPTEHSPKGKTKEFETDAAKMLSTKNDKTLNSLIKGMKDSDRINRWIATEVNGQARKEIIGKLNRTKKEIEE
ncbi:hypothetical protein 7841G3A7_31 [Haloquadratum phage sp.]|jgi:hypothetical protein|nr:hypothetical protein 7841G3A7_31 [Haloquadratum phage sp.]UXF50643.1 hypothetical protein 7908G4C8_16 [Haloquadratum phage sp.]